MQNYFHRVKKNFLKIYNNKFQFIIFSICIILSVFSLSKVFIYIFESYQSKDISNKIYTSVEVLYLEDTEETIIIPQDTYIDESNIYWDYIKTEFIDVNINSLKDINKDTVAWINVSGTNINYPVVQNNDNDYYLKYSFNNIINSAGWIFLDYRNDLYMNNKNLIFYGHSRVDGTMFGTLKNIFNNDWLSNKENFLISLSFESANSIWQVFSVYKVPVTNDYLYIDFPSNNSYTEFLNLIYKRSEFDFETTVNYDDNIITLSTCDGDYDRVVMHAKLIKIDYK
ncbi:MAG: class B sortase [bacterium]